MKTSDYDSACDIDQPLVNRLRRFPREPDMLVYCVRALIALVIRGWLRVYHRFEIIGHENLRTNRSLVIVANHSSHLDTLCLLAALPLRKLNRAFAAAVDYFSKACRALSSRPLLPMRCLCAASSRSPEPLHLLGTSQRSKIS
jgi:hypothetical protein